mmetsp:Transcript_4597/g.6339  ORF Transcript_4597/g.6339 Transcript_4597/m.6339 type:complete len:272 (+) Transcript_4597:71-886(+)
MTMATKQLSVTFLLFMISLGTQGFLVPNFNSNQKLHWKNLSKMSLSEKEVTSQEVAELNSKIDKLVAQVSHLTEEVQKLKGSAATIDSQPKPATKAVPADLTHWRLQLTAGLNDQMAEKKYGQANAGVVKVKDSNPQPVAAKVVEKPPEPEVAQPKAVEPAVAAPPAPATPAPAEDGFYNVAVDFEGTTHNFQCSSEQTILEAALENDIELPSSCMSGTCFTCPGKISKGSVDQEESALEDEQMAQGYCLTCVSYPLSDVELKIISEDDLP